MNTLLFFTILHIIINVCYGIFIKHLSIPKLVKANSSEMILDCHYKVSDSDFQNNESGFVLKWYMNEVSLIYQWIPPNSPAILGILKGKLDENYKVSKHPIYEHRALRIIRPDASFTGLYTCDVTTYVSEHRESAHLLVWAPPTSLNVKYWRPSAHHLNVSCTSIDSSPEPNFQLYFVDPNETRHEINLEGRVDSPGSSQGLFVSRSWGLLPYKAIKDNSVIGCTVFLNRKKTFRETRETVYHSDLPIVFPTTSTTPPPEEEAMKWPSMQASLATSINKEASVVARLLYLLFIALICRQMYC